MDNALNSGGDTFYHAIARLMAKAVVNIFEMIDIDHQATDRLFVTHCLAHLGAQRIFQMMTVAQAG